MANMFDVTTAMASIVQQNNNEIQELSNRIDDIDEKVTELKVSVDTSMKSIDDSIEKIVSLTDNIVAKTQDALEEQRTQIQLMETELEVQQLKNEKRKESGVDYTRQIIGLTDKIKELQFDIDKILQQQKKNERNTGSNIPNIGAGGKGKLAAVLATIFGASVLTYLFLDEEDATTQTAENQPDAKGSEATVDTPKQADQGGKLEETTVNSGSSVETASLKIEEGISAVLGEVTPMNDILGSTDYEKLKPNLDSYVDKAVIDEIAKADKLEASKVIGTETELPQGEQLAKTESMVSSKNFEQKAMKKGESMIQAISMVEKNDDVRRFNIAQNIVTVINEADKEEEMPAKPKPVHTIGKITFNDIMRA